MLNPGWSLFSIVVPTVDPSRPSRAIDAGQYKQYDVCGTGSNTPNSEPGISRFSTPFMNVYSTHGIILTYTLIVLFSHTFGRRTTLLAPSA